MKKHQLVILGATGSIGDSTLELVAQQPEFYQVYGLVAHRNWQKLLELTKKFQPQVIILIDPQQLELLQQQVELLDNPPQVLSGLQATLELVQQPQVDLVISAIVGIAGLLPTLGALSTPKKCLLANKESLVVAGDLCFSVAQANQATIIPLDSEHNAMFQVLPSAVQQQLGSCDLDQAGIDHLILTGSGGPFRDLPLEDFPQITKAQALKHPNWAMGSKITIDSATMMNKGLEYIEARVIYNAQPQQIKVIVHPQSIIHSMVHYKDGSVLAELGRPEMITPIAYAMGYAISNPAQPYRHSLSQQLDFTKVSQLTFREVDPARYPCFALALAGFAHGHLGATVVNSANEVAVESFLNDKISFITIAAIIKQQLEQAIANNFTVSEQYLEQSKNYLSNYLDYLQLTVEQQQLLTNYWALDLQTRHNSKLMIDNLG